jgi:hypothetical protein
VLIVPAHFIAEHLSIALFSHNVAIRFGGSLFAAVVNYMGGVQQQVLLRFGLLGR